MKQTLGSLTESDIAERIKHQTVLVRADYNVRDEQGAIISTSRLQQSLPTLKWLIDQQAKVVVLSHCGRPFDLVKKLVKDGASTSEAMDRVSSILSLDLVQSSLQELLADKTPETVVKFVRASVGNSVRAAVAELDPGGVLLLENCRLSESKEHPGSSRDENCEMGFADEIAGAVQPSMFVFDGFSVCHRKHATVTGLTKALRKEQIAVPVIAGLSLKLEMTEVVDGLCNETVKRPYYAILGGAKVSGKGGKLAAMHGLLDTADRLIIGGAMLYPFLLAQGHQAGSDPLERDSETVEADVQAARQILHKAEGRVILPTRLCGVLKIGDGDESRFLMRDVDNQDLKDLLQTLAPPGTVIWNGPLGVFEDPRFRAGTSVCLRYLVEVTEEHETTTIVGGGDSEAAINECFPSANGVLSHISTGGGAMLAALAGETLHGIEMLDDA